MKYHVRYQRWDPMTSRPKDFAMNEERMDFDRPEVIPNVGDYIKFLKREDGPPGLFRVKSRFFILTCRPGEWDASVNIVVEEAATNIDELIKT